MNRPLRLAECFVAHFVGECGHFAECSLGVFVGFIDILRNVRNVIAIR